ncbi:MAG: two-component system sensor histidine kinase NtrB [Gammaproteobacteria bacterium]
MALAAEQTIQGQLKASLEILSRPIANDTSRRLQRLVSIFRAIVATAILITAALYTDPPILGTRNPNLFLFTAIVYASVAWATLIYQARAIDSHRMLAPVQLVIDIACVTIMLHASGGISSGLGSLLVVFVGAASLTLRSQQTFLAAAVCALAILGEQLASYLMGLSPANAFIPAGVLGAIIFTIALAANPLARRLQESEALAHQRGMDLANMAQLNEYIIQHLRESIVVVDELGNIRLINQSAAKHLGASTRKTGQSLLSLSPDLHRIVLNWRKTGSSSGAPENFISADGSTQIDAYIAPLERASDGPVLIFLEDSSLLAEKVQQTKLAALGRLSASIAHEIRNPVGAMSHAGQLLQESPDVDEYEQRLLDIISKNSKRVSEIVENVLQLSRREPTSPQLISLSTWIDEFAEEFASTLELPPNTFQICSTESLEVRMDPSHLRQICWNLCENAVKYGGATDAAHHVEITYGRHPGNRRPFLEIADRGPGIPASMRDQLFEPFATGRVGGTGLGLFISRELCECNRAALIFEPNDGGGSIFRIVFADPKRWETLS